MSTIIFFRLEKCTLSFWNCRLKESASVIAYIVIDIFLLSTPVDCGKKIAIYEIFCGNYTINLFSSSFFLLFFWRKLSNSWKTNWISMKNTHTSPFFFFFFCMQKIDDQKAVFIMVLSFHKSPWLCQEWKMLIIYLQNHILRWNQNITVELLQAEGSSPDLQQRQLGARGEFQVCRRTSTGENLLTTGLWGPSSGPFLCYPLPKATFSWASGSDSLKEEN